MKIYIANNVAALNALNLDATIEAEFGDEVAIGKILTLAHHGPRSNRPCPCSIPNLLDLGIETVGVSHVDLDTLGGLLAVQGSKPVDYDWVRLFWRAAEFVDVNGVHKLEVFWETSAQNFPGVHRRMVMESLNAWWAFSENPEGRVFAPRDGSAVEIDLSRHFQVLETLLVAPTAESGDWDNPERAELCLKGRKWAETKVRLDELSFVQESNGVILRRSPEFTNHHYRRGHTVVAFNEVNKTVTVSVADNACGFHAGEFVKSLWGPEAGGHAGIGGSPRGREMSFEDAEDAFKALTGVPVE